MSDQKVFRWCFIGAGTLANQVAKQILASGRHKIAAVYTRNSEKCDAFAQKYGAKAYHTAEEAISAPDVDGVYVVTPHNSHYEYAKLALECGKPALVEKAFVINAEQAKELFALADEKGLYLAEAMWTWFAPAANQVKKWLDAGEFGKLESTKFCYHMDARKYAPRVTDPNLAGGALLDVGVYPIAYMIRLFGKPTKVECTGTLEGGIDLKEDVTLTFADGQVHTATISICDFNGFENLHIIGEKAKVKCLFFHATNKVKLIRKQGKNEVCKGSGNYLNEFDNVVEEIRMGLTESRYVPKSATIDVMEVLDECRKQMNLVYPFEK